LAGQKQLFEPVFELGEPVRSGQRGEPIVENRFDALGSLGDREEAGPAANRNPDRGERHLFRHERGALQVFAGEAFAAGALEVVLPPDLPDMRGEPDGAG
jgi:hypothetical protein